MSEQPVNEVTAARGACRADLAAVARGAAEGLVLACLLLLAHFGAIRSRLGAWPEPGLDWYRTFFFEAVLMMALARSVAGPPAGQMQSYFWVVSGIFVLMLAVGSSGPGCLHLGLWVYFAVAGIGLGTVLVPLLVAPAPDPDRHAADWLRFRSLLSVIAPWLAPFGFMVGELAAGQAQPAVFTAPPSGAMIGWAIGVVLVGSEPVGAAPPQATPHEAVQAK
jgi:hypothetical protein